MHTNQVPPATNFAAHLDSVLRALTDFLLPRLHTAYVMLLLNRISRARQRVITVLTLLAAGRTPRIHAPRPDRVRTPSTPNPIKIPRGKGWLRRLFQAHAHPELHNLNVRAWRLESLLNDPETQALLSTAPEATLKSLARSLRPLARMFDLPLPDPLRPPPPKPRVRKPKPPRTPPPPLAHPIPRYVLLAAKAWKKKYG